MNGAIIPHTPIAVDSWIRKTVSNSRLFFLSHAHSDHTSGLSSSWKDHKIYCSKVTKRIVIHKLGVREELLVGLPLGQSVSIPMDEYGREKLTVTLINANHCPGAVMFVFEGYFGTVVYTGDFRYRMDMLRHDIFKVKTIVERLYLDNTYCDPLCSFPTREEASAMVVDIAKRHHNNGFNIVIGMSSLGKEDLLVDIAMSCKTWIGVDAARFSLLELLGLQDVFTTDMESTRVRVLMQREITKQNLQEWNESHPTIAILPTALFEGDVNPYQHMSNVFVVPFSDHSSYEELVSFVSAVQPKKIIPIVLKHRCTRTEPNNVRTNMSIFSSYLNQEPLSPIIIPDTVLKYMYASNASKSNPKRKVRSLSKPNYYHENRRKMCRGVVFPDDLNDPKQVQNSIHGGKEGDDSTDLILSNKQDRNTDESCESVENVNKRIKLTSLDQSDDQLLNLKEEYLSGRRSEKSSHSQKPSPLKVQNVNVEDAENSDILPSQEFPQSKVIPVIVIDDEDDFEDTPAPVRKEKFPFDNAKDCKVSKNQSGRQWNICKKSAAKCNNEEDFEGNLKPVQKETLSFDTANCEPQHDKGATKRKPALKQVEDCKAAKMSNNRQQNKHRTSTAKHYKKCVIDFYPEKHKKAKIPISSKKEAATKDKTNSGCGHSSDSELYAHIYDSQPGTSKDTNYKSSENAGKQSGEICKKKNICKPNIPRIRFDRELGRLCLVGARKSVDTEDFCWFSTNASWIKK